MEDALEKLLEEVNTWNFTTKSPLDIHRAVNRP